MDDANNSAQWIAQRIWALIKLVIFLYIFVFPIVLIAQGLWMYGNVLGSRMEAAKHMASELWIILSYFVGA